MNRTVFKSIFAEDINDYLDIKLCSGYSERSFYYQLKSFDLFCCTNELNAKVFNRLLAEEWIRKRPNEA